jgi:outer membrane protein OmpA-like peptidoglycan-associated protein
MPLAPNKLPDGKDNPDGRALNRRVEFIVVEEIK